MKSLIITLFLMLVNIGHVDGQDTLHYTWGLLRHIHHFSTEKGYREPQYEAEKDPRYKKSKVVHLTPRDLGFSENDIVTGVKILQRAKEQDYVFMGGLWSSGHVCDLYWPRDKKPMGPNTRIFMGVDPTLVDSLGDQYIVTCSFTVVGFVAIKKDGKDVVFPLDSSWFFRKAN